ncbi:MAG TPA: FAD-dependent oxidoreductase [Pseudomonadota bacterium]|nr:FAD-dependent oxidoreductase [Pseudomonadota bacterium]
MAAPRILIIGGGFAGVKCAQTLLRRMRGKAEVVVFSRDNHLVFQPLLPDVAGSSLNPRAIAPPLRQLLPGATCRTEEVLEIDRARSEIVHEGHDGAPRRMRYDHLVIACGNVVNLNLLPGMANHALPLKTIGDAIAMRAHLMRQLEKADLAEDPEQRRFYLTFVVVGGGFSGVEVAGEINDLVRGARPRFPNIGRDEVMVTLLHGRPQLLPEVSPKLRDFARRRMERRGIRVITEASVVEVSSRGATLHDGTKVEGATVICTIGTAPNPLVSKLDAARERGRLVTGPDMRLPDSANVWAVGDCAIVPNAFDGTPAPPTAQFGERAGAQCAHNIARVLRGEATRPFHYRPVGMACGIGGREGVAELFGFKFSGFAAWWLWRSGFLAKIPSLAQKIKVGLDWAWELVFARDLSHFRPAQTDPVNKAHYGPGEELFTNGQPPKALYSIESGEAEVVQRAERGDDCRVLMTLGPGALVGEATVAGHAGSRISVRAKSALDVYVLGNDSLTRLSRALAPIEAIIERAVSRPAQRIWRHHMAAMEALSRHRLGDLPASATLLAADVTDPLGGIYRRMIEQRQGCVVVLEDGAIAGIATRTDLLEALARGATRDSPIRHAMNPKPVCLTVDDSAATAAERMAEGGLKYLPVLDGGGQPVALLSSDDFVRFALAIPR